MSVDLTEDFNGLVEQMPGGSSSGVNPLERIQLLEAAMKKVATLTNAYTATTAAFTQPAEGGSVSVSVETVQWMIKGQHLFIWEESTGKGGLYSLDSIVSSTEIIVTLLTSSMNAAEGEVIASGAKLAAANAASIAWASISEVLAGSETLKAISPATLAGKTATEAQALTGTATNLLINPATLQSKVNDLWASSGTAAKEVWISAIAPTNRPALGTRLDPFDGSTAEKLDQLLKDFADSGADNYLGTGAVVIHLLPGTFKSNGDPEIAGGGWRLPDNWTLQGCGRNVTVLQYNPAVIYSNTDNILIHGKSDGTQTGQVVRDLTLVGNFTTLYTTHTSSGLRLNGIVLYGDDARIENVELRDFGVKTTTTLGFGAIIRGTGSPSANYWRGGAIRNCIYRGHSSDSLAFTAFQIEGSIDPKTESDPAKDYYYRRGAEIENCIVLGSNPEDVELNGYTLYVTDGAVCRNNLAYLAMRGYVESLWDNRRAVIQGNAFIDCGWCIDITNADYPDFARSGYDIAGNVLGGRPHTEDFSIVRLECVTDGEDFDDAATRFMGYMKVRGNLLYHAQAPGGGDNSRGIKASSVQGLTVTDNLFDTQIEDPLVLGSIMDDDTGDVYDNTSVTLDGNIDTDGNLAIDTDYEHQQTDKDAVNESHLVDTDAAIMEKLAALGLRIDDVTVVSINTGAIDLDGVTSNLLYLSDVSGTITDITNGKPYAEYTLIIPEDSGASAGVTHNTAKIAIRSGASIASAVYTRFYKVIPLSASLVMIGD